MSYCCPDCKWTLAFEARPAQAVGEEWDEERWVAYCWNPSCGRHEVTPSLALQRRGDK